VCAYVGGKRAEVFLAHTDIIVLGAGIVGTSIAAHLAKRGLSVALVDRGAPGEGTSYGNAGVIEGNTVFPAAFPSSFAELARIALKRSPVANYHLAFLPQIAPWLLAFRAASQPARLIETAHVMRPLLARAVAEHEALAAEAGADRHLSRRGWLKLYRTDRAFAAQATELDLAARFGIANVRLDRDAALALEPALNGIFRHAVHWTGAVSVDNPLMLQYHDREWGVPVHNDRKHFEFLVLSGAQAGLNFSVVLKKREGYRRAFDKFDPEKVAHYSEARVQKLRSDLEIIRNRMKIEAAVRNARAFLKTQEEFGDFDSYCWRFVGGRPKLNRWKATGQIPATSPESDAFSKDLKQRGFSFVGPTVAYAYMQAAGLVNDHLVSCFRYQELLSEVAAAN